MKENKRTFTYATAPTIKEKAAKKAHKEGLTLSEKIDAMLREYVRRIPVNKNMLVDLPIDYLNVDKIGILGKDGKVHAFNPNDKKKSSLK